MKRAQSIEKLYAKLNWLRRKEGVKSGFREGFVLVTFFENLDIFFFFTMEYYHYHFALLFYSFVFLFLYYLY